MFGINARKPKIKLFIHRDDALIVSLSRHKSLYDPYLIRANAIDKVWRCIRENAKHKKGSAELVLCEVIITPVAEF